MRTSLTIVSASAAMMLAAGANAGYTITQGTSAPTYSSLLTFDEVGAPTGNNLPSNSWAAYGIASITSGEGSNTVTDQSVANPWLTDTTNAFWGPFGVNIDFGYDVTQASLQAWDNGGPPSPFGGGAVLVLFDNGVDVAALPFEPAWGGLGDEWFNITATDGSTFDSMAVFGFAMGFPETIVDNISWNAAPAPGALALLGLAGIVGGRRRRQA